MINNQAGPGTIFKGKVEYFHVYTIKASKFLVFSVYNFTATFYSSVHFAQQLY